MAHTKVGIYRQYFGAVPLRGDGQPLPRSEWSKKRPSSWIVRWFGIDGKRYSKSFDTKSKAELYARKKQDEVHEGRGDPPPTVTLKAFVTEHGRIMKGQVAPETLHDQLRALNMLMKHVGANVPLHSITPRHAESYIAMRAASGIEVATVNKDIRTLKRVFNLAIDPRGYLRRDGNPFARIKQRKQSPSPVRYVTAEEFDKLMKVALTLWWKALLAVAYTTGARLGEILNLTWADVDFEHGRVRVVSKEAGEEHAAWEPKDHEGRVLPVPAWTMQLLVDLQAAAPEGNPYLFLSTARLAHIQSGVELGTWKETRPLLNNLNKRLEVLRRKAGVAQFTYHDLRRTCITNWARHVAIHVVQKLAGHSDLKTTQHYYLSVQEDDLEKARQVHEKPRDENLSDKKMTN